MKLRSVRWAQDREPQMLRRETLQLLVEGERVHEHRAATYDGIGRQALVVLVVDLLRRATAYPASAATSLRIAGHRRTGRAW